MNELELKLCDIQGRLFELSADKNISSEYFIKKFMSSATAKALDSEYNRMQWSGEEYLLSEILSEQDDPVTTDKTVFSKEILFWIGYIYRYWHLLTGESSKVIIKKASPKKMKRNYLIFHTMGPELAVEKLKETD